MSHKCAHTRPLTVALVTCGEHEGRPLLLRDDRFEVAGYGVLPPLQLLNHDRADWLRWTSPATRSACLTLALALLGSNGEGRDAQVHVPSSNAKRRPDVERVRQR